MKNYLFLTILTFNFTAIAIETDVFLPALPEMMRYFNTTEDIIQLLVSVNFLGLGISGLIFGPLSDTWGRKKTTLLGIGIFLLSSIGCVFTESIELLIIFRFLQGMGAGSPFNISGASLFDKYPAKESAKLLALLNAVVTGTLAIAPIIGGYLNLYYGWRSCFIFIVATSAISFIATLFFMEETLEEKSRMPFQFIPILKNYAKLTLSFEYMANIMMPTLMRAVLLVYIANLSLIFIDHLGVDKSIFGYYQGVVFIAIMTFSTYASYCIGKYGTNATKNFGLIIFIAGSILLYLVSILAPDSPALISVAMAIVLAGTSFSFSIFFTQAIAVFPEIKGAAIALNNAMCLGFGGIVVSITSLFFDGSIMPVALVVLATSILCYLLNLAIKVKERKRILYEQQAM